MSEYSVAACVAFGNNAFDASPTWVDITGDIKGFTTHRGRTYEMGRMEAGTASVALNNTSGNYWKNNASGSYYPNVTPMKQFNIRVTPVVEQISNGGFETGNPPTGWTLVGAGASYARSNTQSHAGAYSLSITRVGADCFSYQTILG